MLLHLLDAPVGPRLEDDEGLLLVLELLQGLRNFLPHDDYLNALRVHGGAFLLHLSHVAVISMDERLYLLAPLLKVGLLCG
ncbi:hypothetical protein E2562_037246 [Oryza meyeriana var. granulata]|uniref:Uncharacterized protein n=1 Tax=Oryza meyeriana var. granulata TaxID=110450 RepID=A0A6G1DT82_9ORYZ|nr:hypothetical protein E2562_037246 [Oryza meyeriana var. granulata]